MNSESSDPPAVPSAAAKAESAVPRDDEIESEIGETRRRAFSWRRLLLQGVGFAIGISLLAWLVWRATRDPAIWERLRNADPLLVVALLGCSAVSLFINGSIFWVAVQPVRKLPFGEVQWVNALAGLLNYAPIRLGIVARLAWHLRVDRMRLREVLAWFASITWTVLVPLGAAITGALVAGQLDLIFVGVVLGVVVLGGLAAPALARLPIIQRRCAGLDRVVTDPRALWGSLLLRLLDLVFWSLRMMLAVEILGIDLTMSQSFMLAMANLAITLNPLGRVGFREVTVAFIAARMAAGSGDDLLDRSSQLAVVESAGEFLVWLPAGTIAAFMLARRWRNATRTTPRTPRA